MRSHKFGQFLTPLSHFHAFMPFCHEHEMPYPFPLFAWHHLWMTPYKIKQFEKTWREGGWLTEYPFHVVKFCTAKLDMLLLKLHFTCCSRIEQTYPSFLWKQNYSGIWIADIWTLFRLSAIQMVIWIAEKCSLLLRFQSFSESSNDRTTFNHLNTGWVFFRSPL